MADLVRNSRKRKSARDIAGDDDSAEDCKVAKKPRNPKKAIKPPTQKKKKAAASEAGDAAGAGTAGPTAEHSEDYPYIPEEVWELIQAGLGECSETQSSVRPPR